MVFCPITELQENIYQTLIECEDVQLVLHNSEPCDCHSGEKRGKCCYQVGYYSVCVCVCAVCVHACELEHIFQG